MKETRELTSIYYRRSVKRPASPVLQGFCPVCGSRLEAVFIHEVDSAGLQRGDREGEGGSVFRLVRDDADAQVEKGSRM